MWRRFATRKPEFQLGVKSLGKGTTPLGYPQRPFNRTENAEKLRALLREKCYTPGVHLSESVKEFARRDEEFNTFLRDFKKEEEPKWRSILDAKTLQDFAHFEKDLEKTPQQRLDELHMHEQMRKRQIVRSFAKAASPDFETVIKEPDIPDHEFGLNLATLFNSKDFEIMFMDAGTTTNVTAQQRVNQKHVLLYMGNCDGIIAFGRGKGWEYSNAFDSAITEMKKSIVAIGFDPLMSFTRYLEHTFHGITVRISPTETGGVKCNVTYANFLFFAGIRNATLSIVGRRNFPYQVTKAVYYALLRCVTPKYTAEMTGRKIYEIAHGRPPKSGENSLIFRS